ncbi:glycosyltransferase [Paenarthrobacter sp. NPDC089322]|uniref:glycosyltransferase n=1 Tax=Paenarthrobacter sp. NPDC089322 TaxID=3155065 RepID=UPI00341C44CD
MGSEITDCLDGSATHFVLTRFNVRSFYHKAEPTDAWLQERVRLFKDYCIPGFRHQTENRFTWLVFFDSLSPTWLREEIDGLAEDTFHPVYVDGPFSQEFLSETIGRLCSTPYVITTRVDNDDAVANDFIETIQGCFESQEAAFINLVNGAQYAERKLYLRPYTMNPFSSLIERSADNRPATVFVEHHYRIDAHAPVLNVRTKHPMWLQVIHGGNVLNEVVGLRTSAGAVAPHFSVQLDVDDSLPARIYDQILGTARILLRLLRKPSRLKDLAKTLVARRARTSS